MIIKHDEPLKNYTTFRMGGFAKTIFFPENIEDIELLYDKNGDAFSYILGGGSNLLINDSHYFGEVICLKMLNVKIIREGDGVYQIGGGMRLQKIINEINGDGYGGIEYLYSVPGLLGGAIYMNAGRGPTHHQCISDYLESVTVFINGQVRTLKKEECAFSHRYSAFQDMVNPIILDAHFRFHNEEKDKLREARESRMKLVKEKQDNTKPNFGSVFCKSNTKIMKILCSISNKKGVHYSKKTPNWLLNDNGTYEQAIHEIKKAERLHKIMRQSCKREIIIWD
ncbi:MAG: FAD-binding protein [Oribacterium sp.]|nr:FAD-binding protein [Oribacterium sp.]MBQ5330774.1 FAD-binding protein [Oscillospiraceae bacterium]